MYSSKGDTRKMTMPDKCKDCENELLLKLADLETKYDRLEYYSKILEKCLDTKDELCKVLREENDELKNKLRLYNEV